MNNQEEWKDLEGYEDFYKVSSFGEIFSLRKKRVLKHSLSNKGYKQISIQINNTPKTHSIHRLVAKAFIPNPENKPQVNHKDGNKLNNNVSNLEWVNNSENQIHSKKTGLNNCFGEKCHLSKLKKSDINTIKKLYSEGLKQKNIAEIYGLHQSSISLIINNKTWK